MVTIIERAGEGRRVTIVAAAGQQCEDVDMADLPVGQERVRKFDLWLALLAGDTVWQQGREPPTIRERGVAALMLVSLLMTLVTQAIALSSRVDFFGEQALSAHDRLLVITMAASVAAATALAVRPARLLLRVPRNGTSFWWSVGWRALAYLTLIGAAVGLLPAPRALGAIPLGLVGGSDALLALWALGIRPQPFRWIKRFFFSMVHFGAVGAIVAFAVFAPDVVPIRMVASLYVAMWTGIIVTCLTVGGMSRFTSIVDAHREEEHREITAKERALRAHWLHDDVLSEVRLTTLRIDADHMSAESTRRELQDLDHRLRLRQLDEIVRGGSPHIYEIIQPHLRRAQTLGLELHEVPPFESIDIRLDERAGQLVNRAVSVLVSNAVNAGAMRLGVRVARPQRGIIELSVIDDAGGFDLDAVPEGRGLHTLGRQLGEHALIRTDAPGGSCVTARIAIDSTARGAIGPVSVTAGAR